MSNGDRDRLRSIKTFPALVAYLRDELGWPIETEHFDDLTFDYEPEELGLNAEIAAIIEEIKQLRPLESNQPWGIFFIKFEPKRLPVVALRRILGKLVVKKRASANRSEQATWQLNDLLFISAYGEGDQRQINLAHFAENKETGSLPTLKVLGWDEADRDLKIDHVRQEMEQKLRWPDDPSDLDEWRGSWSSAFTLRHREVITTSRMLAEQLAQLAMAVRKRLNLVLEMEVEGGPLRKLLKAFRDTLVHDLTEDGFADMYAQTVSYGLLSEKMMPRRGDGSSLGLGSLRVINPFLGELLDNCRTIGRRHGLMDFDELGVGEVEDLLNDPNTKYNDILLDFDNRNPKKDPVVHFYEDFLREYDAEQRVKRGVFYTPKPVVSFIVRSVDEILRNEFGLEDGLADITTWSEISKRYPEMQLPEHISGDDPFVKILDPALGTGTFLVETIDLIHKTMIAKWKYEGHMELEIPNLWNKYVPNYLLPRLYGFELMMAPYAIAHMKIGLKLLETGYRFESPVRSHIYLTNTLEPSQEISEQFTFIMPSLASEARAANLAKAGVCFTIVIGNPPYSNYSANLSVQCRKLVDKYRCFHGQPIRERNQLQFERNLQDDFVKFVAISEDRISSAQLGVFGMITNATMLASHSLRGMREHLLNTFNELYELHLHGGSNEIFEGAEEDNNVFDIEQAVAIHIHRRCHINATSVLHYEELKGSRLSKYEILLESTIDKLSGKIVRPDETNCSFIPSDNDSPETMIVLDSMFRQFGAGVKTNRDMVAIAFQQSELLETVRNFKSSLISKGNPYTYIQDILYRPFDKRFIFYHDQVVSSRSYPTMRHMIEGPNIGIVACSTWTTPGRFSISVSRKMVEMKAGTHDRGTTFFPLYCYDQIVGKSLAPEVNFTSDFIKAWEAATGMHFIGQGHGDLQKTSSVDDILHWIIGCCHSPTLRTRHRGALATGFPVIPLPNSVGLLRKLTAIGADLVALHLLDDEYPTASWNIAQCGGGPLTKPITKFIDRGSRLVEKGQPRYRDGKVYINTSSYFDGVSEEVWNFYVGGYQVCDKWIKDRKPKKGAPGRVLTDEDIAHYQKIIIALNETSRLMNKIDEVIEEHGGWPGAFATVSLTDAKITKKL